MDLLLIRIASAVLIAAAYMLFDIFNNRNVPGMLAYATLGYGAVLTLLYLSTTAILVSAAIAFVVLGIGSSKSSRFASASRTFASPSRDNCPPLSCVVFNE